MSVEPRQMITLKVGATQADSEIVTFKGLPSELEHLAICFHRNHLNNAPPLVRIHSECLTGDVFHSSRCDCGEQLEEAISLLDKTGGFLLYMRQEGRGIGLYNKIDAYALQDEGLNTYDANQKLGFKDDEREYKEAADMLKCLGVKQVRLVTNNPLKVKQLQSNRIFVDSIVNTSVFAKDDNRAYLKAKKIHGKHQLHF